MSEIRMVVGLGNPGRGYAQTRHNIGFKVVDSLAEALGIKVGKRKFGGVAGDGEFADKKLILLKPMQFMNRSGQVVATAAGFYKLCADDVLVVVDDMAIETGRIRIRSKGSAGGHNGLRDIIEKLGTENVGRLRVGIGSSGAEQGYNYVLSRSPAEEKPLLESSVDRAKEAVLCWLESGIDEAMNRFNSQDFEK